MVADTLANQSHERRPTGALPRVLSSSEIVYVFILLTNTDYPLFWGNVRACACNVYAISRVDKSKSVEPDSGVEPEEAGHPSSVTWQWNVWLQCLL